MSKPTLESSMVAVGDKWQPHTVGGHPVAGLVQDGEYIYGWIANYWGGPQGASEPRCVCLAGWSMWHPTTWTLSGTHPGGQSDLVPVTLHDTSQKHAHAPQDKRTVPADTQCPVELWTCACGAWAEAQLTGHGWIGEWQTGPLPDRLQEGQA